MSATSGADLIISPNKVAWFLMQGFTAKYYFRKAANGDFAVNRPARPCRKERHGMYLCDIIQICLKEADCGYGKALKKKQKAVKKETTPDINGVEFIIKGTLTPGSVIKEGTASRRHPSGGQNSP